MEGDRDGVEDVEGVSVTGWEIKECWFRGLNGVNCGWCCDCPALSFQIECVISFDYGNLPGRVGLGMVRLSE